MPSIWRKWLRNPLQMGSIQPSSKGLINLMISQVPKDAHIIVEFGAGTGPITAALAKKFSQAQIYSLELEPELARKVQEQLKDYSNLKVFNADVVDIKKILPEELVGQVDVVISSLPLLNISEAGNKKIFQSAFEVLKPSASFVQFTYLPFMPPSNAHKQLGLWSQYVGVEIKNMPPAFVWLFKRMP